MFFGYILKWLWYGNESLTKVICFSKNDQAYIVFHIIQISKLTEMNAAVKLILICNEQQVVFVTSNKQFL